MADLPTRPRTIPRRVALTGATGFIGRHVLDRLAADGWHVRALTRRPDSLARSSNVTPVLGSMSDGQALAELVDGADAVVHCAGLIAARNRQAYDAVNVAGTKLLLGAAVAQAQPPLLVHLSSLAAREPQISDYAASKRRGEAAVEALGAELNWHIVRPPAVYGPGDRATLPMFRLLNHGFAPQPRWEARFSLIYVADLAAALAALAGAPRQGGAILELDDGRAGGYGWDDLADAAAALLDRRMRRIPLPVWVLRTTAVLSSGAAW
ncbi:MAG: SDR family NAD(P)-dependent oxidoreductase, partial [Alphaproteobacteria bacterium]|nr:SDR family NAD(P)-dependent oxidoreductase [Alphaproteobacteria bacterium]